MSKNDVLKIIDEHYSDTSTAAPNSGVTVGSGDADTVDGFDASATPQANTLIALDANAKIPRAAMPDSDNVGGPATGAHGLIYFGPTTWLVEDLATSDTEITVKHRMFDGDEAVLLSHYTVPCEYIFLTGTITQSGDYWKYSCSRGELSSTAQEFPANAQAISLGADDGGFIYAASGDTDNGSAPDNLEYLPTAITNSPYIAIYENGAAHSQTWKVTLGRLSNTPTSFQNLFPDVTDWDRFGLAAEDAFLSGGIHALYGDIAGTLEVGGRIEILESGTSFTSWSDYGDATGLVLGLDDSVSPNVGKLLGLDAGVAQAYFDGDGTIKFAAGKGILDVDGFEYTEDANNYWKLKPDASSVYTQFITSERDVTLQVENTSNNVSGKFVAVGTAVYAESSGSTAIYANVKPTTSSITYGIKVSNANSGGYHYAIKADGGDYTLYLTGAPVYGGGERYTNLGDATADTDALNRQTADGRYLLTTTTDYLKADGSIAGATSQAQSFGTNGIKADVIAESTTDNGVSISNTIDVTGDVLFSGNLGTEEGSYNAIIGSAFAANTGYTYIIAAGANIGNSATGNVHRNMIVGSGIANSTEGNIYYDNIVGSSIVNSSTGNVIYNNLVGANILSSATGNIYHSLITGQYIATSITGDAKYILSVGLYNLYDTTNVTNLNRVIAMPYEALRESSASNLNDAIAIGFRAGYQNEYNQPALFGRDATATADNQVVIGSEFYTGGILLDTNVIIPDARNIILDTTTGTQIGTSASQKLALWAATPVTQRNHINDATTSTVVSTVNSILDALEDVGILATS